jgi:predicted ribosome quality control (RQC) complex YloA/Tae2 family protein
LLDEITASVEKINDYIETGKYPVIQKAYSSSQIIVLVLRIPGDTFYLNIGRGNESQGIAFFRNKLQAPSRIYDSFLGLIRNLLIGSALSCIRKISSNTFILEFKKKSGDVVVALSWIDEKLYFSYMKKTSTDIEALIPWFDPKKTILSSEEEFFIRMDNLKKNKGFTNIGLEPNQGSLEVIKKRKNKFKKSLIKKIENIKRDLDKAKSWREWDTFVQKAILGEVSLDQTHECKMGSLNIKFKTTKHHHKIDEIYQQIKRFKAKEAFIEERYNFFLAQLDKPDHFDSLMTEKASIRKPVWLSKTEKKQSESNSFGGLPKKIKTSVGEVMIGRSALENDKIRREWAKKEDMWFHFEEIPGPHMFVKLKNDNLDTSEIIALCSMLMSMVDQNLIEMRFTYTPVKYLKGVKGSRGKVTYHNAKFIKVTYCDQWRQKLSLLLEES